MAERTSRLTKVDNTRDKLQSLRDNEVGSSKPQKVSYSLSKPFVPGTESLTNTTAGDTQNGIRVSGPLHISSEVSVQPLTFVLTKYMYFVFITLKLLAIVIIQNDLP